MHIQIITLLILIIDLALFCGIIIITAPFVCLKYLLIKVQKRHTNIIWLSGAGDVESILKKFGKLDFTINYDGPVNFPLIQLFWFPASSTILGMKVKNNFEINQMAYNHIVRYFQFTGWYIYCLRILYRTDPNVGLIRAFDPYFIGLSGVFLSIMSGKPLCVSIHADYEQREKLQTGVIPCWYRSKRLTQRIEKLVTSRAKFILPIRETMKDHFYSIGVCEKKIRVIPHGIDLSPFQNDEKIHLSEYSDKNDIQNLVSSVMRIENENYFTDVLQIAACVVRENNNALFIIAGDGSKVRDAHHFIQVNHLDKHVQMPGYLSREKAMELRKQSTVNLCLMAGFSLIEACAAGRPVIAYDVEWHHELVIDGETGFLIKEGDVETAAEKIIFLIQNPEIADRMGAAARKRAFERHDINKTALIKQRIYEELMALKQ